ncbi:MAG: SDR family NAD(P)-dependent oxidoreductase [Candidatus Nanopelagicales bacterium]
MSTASDDLTGRTAIVTGASKGIGRSIAELFAARGANVVLGARSAPLLGDVAAGITERGGVAVEVEVDVMAEDAPARLVAAAVDAFGGVDILVNNAGGNSFMTPLATMRFSGWRKTLDLNLDSIVRLIQEALPHLVASGHGVIVNVSSVTALRGSPLMAHYGAAKAALVSLTQSLAIETAGDGIRVNALVPGWIATDLTGFLRTDETVESHVLDRVPMRRWGTPDEIAQGALFLASDASSFMTGQSLVLDGGLSAQP